MRLAYADPPYIGQAMKHYKREEVDHVDLLRQLECFDGWALSCSTPSLATILPLCPEGCRIASWVKPFAIFKPNVNPAYAWEPVIFKSGRKRARTEPTVRDWISCNIRLKAGLSGAKPKEVVRWILVDLLGWQEGDQVVDLFPGTGTTADVLADLGQFALERERREP